MRIDATTIRPGDVLIVNVPQPLTAENIAAVKAHVELEFPGHQVIVLSGGITLQVARSLEPLTPAEIVQRNADDMGMPG
jgi:hypothetical protein